MPAYYWQLEEGEEAVLSLVGRYLLEQWCFVVTAAGCCCEEGEDESSEGAGGDAATATKVLSRRCGSALGGGTCVSRTTD